jgi:hypothetical protein
MSNENKPVNTKPVTLIPNSYVEYYGHALFL